MNKQNKEKVVIISNFHEDNEISRTNMTYKYFISKEFDTTVLYSNFSHSLKKFRNLNNKDFVLLKTISYGSSLSLRRILSYIIFSYRVFVFLQKNKYDIIYVNLPPNILALAVFLFPRKKNITIVDIIDLWPESFPHAGSVAKKAIVLLFGGFLKKIRKFAIDRSDYCIAESNLFYRKLNLKSKKKSRVIHLKKFQTKKITLDNPSNDFSIAYLGNIGNIYDFDSLFTIIKELEKIRLVHLHVIGLGPVSDWFFEKLDVMNINYTYHGASFNENLKRDILSNCWFGFNGYKKNTEVALSYKSIDYLSYGVPLINSAKEDTEDLVNMENIGFNFDSNNISELISMLSIISYSEIIKMKIDTYKVFQNKFSGQSYFDEMNDVLRELQ
jgi:hypothetical protein